MQTQSVHGHEVLRLIGSTAVPSEADLIRAANEKFGPATRYHTCSAQDLTIEQLVAFLSARGKFTRTPNGLRLESGKVCAEVG